MFEKLYVYVLENATQLNALGNALKTFKLNLINGSYGMRMSFSYGETLTPRVQQYPSSNLITISSLQT
jgi:hypothetical protein